MQSYIPFPDIDPNLVVIPYLDLPIRWYALAYIAGLLLGAWLVAMLLRRPTLWPDDTAPMPSARVEDLLSAMVLGVIVGGRLGYVVFYKPFHFFGSLQGAIDIFRVWDGGMAFHGGFLGVVVALVWFCRARGYPLISMGDAIAIAAPIGIFFGRVANFVNGELWGRPTLQSWGVLFPDPRAAVCPPNWPGEVCARHPSQLYEAALEGLLLFAIMLLVVRLGGLKRPGFLIGIFLLGYGLARSVVENFRQGDAQYVSEGNPFGHALMVGPLNFTMGQILSLPMILVGGLVLVLAWRRA